MGDFTMQLLPAFNRFVGIREGPCPTIVTRKTAVVGWKWDPILDRSPQVDAAALHRATKQCSAECVRVCALSIVGIVIDVSVNVNSNLTFPPTCTKLEGGNSPMQFLA